MSEPDPDEVSKLARQKELSRNRQRKRRANLTEEDREKKKEYDRQRYKKRKTVRNPEIAESEDDNNNSQPELISERLRLKNLNTKLEKDMQKYKITNVELLFEKKLEELHILDCKKCDTFYWSTHKSCYCGKFNNMVEHLLKIGDVPEELMNLTYVEELLISKIHPMISVYRLKGGQYAFKGNVINFRQDVSGFAKKLPHAVTVLDGLISVCCNTPCFHQDFMIRRDKVSIALHWLKNNNIYYKDVEIDLQTILSLPSKGHYSTLLNIEDNKLTVNSDEADPETECIDRVVVPGILPISTQEKVRHQLKWPTISCDPVNEFNSKGYIVQAFPVLFPYGVGDLSDVKDKKTTARVYFQFLMQRSDRRFSKHKLFPYFALNSILRWEALSLGTLYMKKKPDLKSMNIEHLKDMVTESMALPKSVMLYSSSMRGSKSYWMSRTYELDSLVDRFGLPTIFFSMSAADHHWPRQFEIILSRSSQELTLSVVSEKQRRDLLIENADLCSDYFYEMATIFVLEVLVPFLKIFEYWFRFEWQMRGVAHLHGVFWLAGSPNVLNYESMSEAEKKEIIDYFSNLVSAWNPDCQYVVTANHPCRLKISEITDKEEDIASLVNTVQKHKCSSYCLKPVKNSRGRSNDNSLQCRHHFPHKLQEINTIEKNDRGHLEFFPMRNDPFINKFHEFILRAIRSNHDPTPIISYNGFVRYISKYASKGEIKSSDLLQLLKLIIYHSDADQSVKTVIQKLFVNLAADRDYSFQEVMHLLKGHKLYQCSRSFVVLNLSESDWQPTGDLSILSPDSSSDQKTVDPLESYANRPANFNQKTLFELVKWYDIKNYKKHLKEKVVRIIPRFKEKNDVTASESIWRQNALLNIPWRNIADLYLNESWEFTCSSHNVSLEKFPYPIHVIDEQYSDDEDNEIDDLKMKDEDWMKITRMDGQISMENVVYRLGERLIDISYPWSQNICDEYFADIMYNLVSDARKSAVIEKNLSTLPACSPDQKYVISILKRQIINIQNLHNNDPAVPKISVCEGFAGSGKSILLQSMVKIVEESFGIGSAWVLAPTGSSALHVNGQTIHSAVRLNWKDLNNMPDLKGETLFKWREKYEKVRFVFVEEYGMVGCKLIHVLNKRLCQLTESNEPFGNLTIWFMGNIRQLPPVGDTPWYKEDLTDASATVVAGSMLHKKIDLVCFLSSQLRQTNMQYLQCLQNVSVGKITDNDKILLKQRIRTSEEVLQMENFQNAVHIFSRNKDVDFFNLQKLADEGKPVLRIDAENSSRYAKACSSDQAMGLPQTLFLSVGCRIMLKRNLWVEGGLVNGSLGNVIDIVYKSSSDDTPIAVVVQFDDYFGPVLPSGGVPIIRYSNSWYSRNIYCSRTMFPLVLAYSVTIYKSEGLTLPRVAFHILAKEIAAGEFYVALSRVKSPQDIVIVYDGEDIDNCPLFHLNSDIYVEKIAAEQKLMLKCSKAI